jgi:hypothetical protein
MRYIKERLYTVVEIAEGTQPHRSPPRPPPYPATAPHPTTISTSNTTDTTNNVTKKHVTTNITFKGGCWIGWRRTRFSTRRALG